MTDYVSPYPTTSGVWSLESTRRAPPNRSVHVPHTIPRFLPLVTYFYY